MSEEKQYTLTEYVFRDIRFGNEYPKFANDDEFVQLKELDPITSVKEYHKLVVRNYKPDAERWQIALKSYLNYPCLKDKVEIEKRDNNRFFLNFKGDSVSITADLLTGPTNIIEHAETLIKCYPDRAADIYGALLSFCSVAYTVGNCCPTMKNPRAGGDTCWYKLENNHKTGESDNLSRVLKQEWYKDPNKRVATNMFVIFPEKDISGREIVNRLMLNDYYDDNYNLIINKTPQEYVAKGVDKYIDFLRLVTTLIIKRGIRIYNALPDNMKKTE